ncbi:hypothetical protein RFI_32180 [Reticulomyxa filosa]|uniref:Uncharacterized protein n=1 Tax=Reticulomyxa filosa TaxID=46433 RepID=X6LVN6_RETFI|nr:hypothetical protein RFI_32180 [Reticulomyxa filosa]|eukprot:ETO05217.1 hypothetical protein RFI_32180 [Reticulomyxa filosa]
MLLYFINIFTISFIVFFIKIPYVYIVRQLFAENVKNANHEDILKKIATSFLIFLKVDHVLQNLSFKKILNLNYFLSNFFEFFNLKNIYNIANVTFFIKRILMLFMTLILIFYRKEASVNYCEIFLHSVGQSSTFLFFFEEYIWTIFFLTSFLLEVLELYVTATIFGQENNNIAIGEQCVDDIPRDNGCSCCDVALIVVAIGYSNTRFVLCTLCCYPYYVFIASYCYQVLYLRLSTEVSKRLAMYHSEDVGIFWQNADQNLGRKEKPL